MTIAPWRSQLAHSLHKHRNQPESRYLQLATVGSDQRPANRTVVFRGFFNDTDQLKFITDLRSQKVSQIQHNSWGEACWYFPQTREQYRIAGQLILISETTIDETMQIARQEMWQELSDAARIQFTWPHPGQPRLEDSTYRSPTSPCVALTLPTFCLLLLEPSQVDYLELRGTPQNRWIYTRNDVQTWFTQFINS